MKRVVSLFSGGGGLDIGLEAAGFETLLSTDIDPYSCNTLEANKVVSKQRGKPFLSDTIILQSDIANLTPKRILDLTGQKKGEVDLLSGGPPCQAFSVFGKRKGTEDPRGMLAFQYLRILKSIEPKAFIFENVPGLLTIDNGSIFELLKKKLSSPSKKLNYSISVLRLNAVNFGVPQFRERVFILGSKFGHTVSTVPPTCVEDVGMFPDLLKWRTVKDGLKGIPRTPRNQLPNHIGRNHSERIITRYSKMDFGERDHYTRINKLNPSRPSFTIIVGSDAGGGKGHINPFQPREVTPRESARLQCFPDWWGFCGTSRHPIRQVGNAVPTLAALCIGRKILFELFDCQPRTYREGVELLDQQHLFTAKELAHLG